MTTANSAEQGKVDIDFAECAVPKWSRRRFVTMFMIMLGFTFFSASMWVGQEMAAGLDFWGFIKALLLGGAILGIYTGLLGYVGAETGLSLDLLSKRTFGEKGSYISDFRLFWSECKFGFLREGYSPLPDLLSGRQFHCKSFLPQVSSQKLAHN